MKEIEERYNQLREIIDNNFIDRNLKENHDRDYIRLTDISKLARNEDEEAFIIEYLGHKGIQVEGSTAYYSGIFDNYTQTRKLDFYKTPERLSGKEETKLLEEYQQTKDIQIRNRLVEANMYKVKYFSKYIADYYGFHGDSEELESYGNVSLIKAIENYNPSEREKKAYFSKCIRYGVIAGLMIENFGKDGARFYDLLSKNRNSNCAYYEYFNVKKQVENETGEILEENPNLIDEIASILVKKGHCSLEQARELRDKVSILNSYSYEEIGKVDEDIGNIIEEEWDALFQEELASFIQSMINNIDEQKAYALTEYYGLNGGTPKILEEIASSVGVSRETIRNRRDSGKETLKRKLKNRENYDKTRSFLEGINQDGYSYYISKKKIKE